MYRWLEHTAEIELLIEDETPEAVFTEAMVALGDVLGDARGGEPVTHDVRIRAPDRAALLAGWMEELVFLAETDGFIPHRIERLELDAETLTARVGGERSVPQSLIKAVTYHRLEMEPAGGGWRARVILDV
jgi:SHS2 domain-containing protein